MRGWLGIGCGDKEETTMSELTELQVNDLLATLPGWRLVDRAGRLRIEKVFKTGNFQAGVAFLTRVAAVADELNHHPDVLLTYPRVTIQLTTHDAGGVTEKDFELAKRIDALGV
jgi:4a-hydroxytetrahydrobiopterin dehydratase